MKKEMCAASTLLTLAVLAGADTPPANAAKTAPACAGARYRQFDFWIGDWSVTQGGKAAGTNRIDRILEGCGLLENWHGAGGSVGHSLNYYDPARQVWHQTWVDNQAGALELEGRFERGEMVLSGSTLDAAGKTLLNRITWTPNRDGSVRQHWESSTDGGKSWTTAFDGLYVRR